MDVNSRKSLKIKNKTNYFNPSISRTHNRFSSSHSYQSRSIKIEGYETRLYWQYRYCQDNDGQTFFYTLTYNDDHIPTYKVSKKLDDMNFTDDRKHCNPKYSSVKVNCFDYEDLRDLLTGGFRKKLLRKYGTTFKYFIGAELGDGKGSRGLHNNPHYHILFFLENAKNDKYPYIKISPKDFRHLVREYWQGIDQDECSGRWYDYTQFKYGIAKEGENCGLVSDFRACQYVAKYVCKDVKLVQHEQDIAHQLWYRYRKSIVDEGLYEEYYHSRIYEMFNTPLNSKRTSWCFTDQQLAQELVPELFMEFNGQVIGPEKYSVLVESIISKCRLHQDWSYFVADKVNEKVKVGINEWRNRYCNKCRISQGVGDYAIQFIKDKMNPTIQVPSKRGFKNRPISMYYYRKMYCDVVKDPQGNNLYVLNQLGQAFKLGSLSNKITKMADQASSRFRLIVENKSLYEKVISSDVNTDFNWSYFNFKTYINTLLDTDNIQNIVNRYAQYKLVYEDRFFKYDSRRHSEDVDFPVIDVFSDYKRFITPSYFVSRYNPYALSDFLESDGEGYLPYLTHPYFLRYRCIFALFDLLADYFFVQSDVKAQTKAEEIQATKRFHSQLKLKEFYAGFQN